jgi:hypothetical protein
MRHCGLPSPIHGQRMPNHDSPPNCCGSLTTRHGYPLTMCCDSTMPRHG